MRSLALALVASLLVGASAGPVAAVAQPASGTTPSVLAVTSPTVEQLIGQKLIVRMEGTTPTASLLDRIRRGQIGGVILFGANVTTKTALIALTTKLQGAARAGGQPRLLIAVDQEGGIVKRIPWAPPTLSAKQMGAIGLASTAQSQGASTGSALRGLGINVNFAPVADVPVYTSSFMYKQGRTWSFSATKTATLANAFATGLRSYKVLPTFKHFPGIGYARYNTDLYVDTILASKSMLAPGLLPYRTAISKGMPLVMLSNANYTAYDTTAAAGWSHAIAVTLLRTTLGFKGVTVTDSLDAAAATRRVSTASVATKSARAGVDMLLITASEATTRSVFATLVQQAKAGAISLTTLRTSYSRILALKAGL